MAEEGRYKLAAVHDARSRDERGRRGDLAAAVGDAREARAQLEAARLRTSARREALAAAAATRDTLLATRSTPARIAGAEQFAARRRRELELAIGEELRLETALDERQSGVDVARRTLARARADREVIDRHFTQWRETRKKLAERRED